MALRAGQLMHSLVCTVYAETTIREAALLFWETGYSALPVVNSHYQLIGVVSAADLLPRPLGHPLPETVASVMTAKPALTYMSTSADVAVVAARMRYYDVRVMPIVEPGRHSYLAGILTRGDLLRRRSAKSPPRPPRHPPSGPLARDVMTPAHLVEWVRESDPAEMAADRLNHRAYTALPVLDNGGRFVGLVSEADLEWPTRLDWTGVRRKRDPRTVAEVMTVEVVTRSPDTHVGELAQLLYPGALRMVPIIDDHQRIAGVVSRTDLLHPDTLATLEAAMAPSGSAPVSEHVLREPVAPRNWSGLRGVITRLRAARVGPRRA